MSQDPTESGGSTAPASQSDPATLADKPVAWAISGGARGMENQCLALAEAAGFAPVPLRVAAKAPWRWLPEMAWSVWGKVPSRLSAENRQMLDGPWPDLVVACGRQSVPLAIHIKRVSEGRTFVVQCQDPRVTPALFDLVVPPDHDNVTPAQNVLSIVGSPNLALPWRLAEASGKWASKFDTLGRPLVAVAIGGSSSAYRLNRSSIDELFRCLEKMQTESGARLAITTSRRTGPDNEELIQAHAKRLGAWVWDGSGDSPILGLYACADAIVVTEDSVNMAAEAAASGKPLYVAELDGGSEKFDHFHDVLKARGIARTLTHAPLEAWSYPPLTETLRAAQEIRQRMSDRGFALPAEPQTGH